MPKGLPASCCQVGGSGDASWPAPTSNAALMEVLPAARLGVDRWPKVGVCAFAWYICTKAGGCPAVAGMSWPTCAAPKYVNRAMLNACCRHALLERTRKGFHKKPKRAI